MLKKIYFTGVEKKPGKSFVSIGLAAVLKEQYPDFKYFQLFKESDDRHKALLETLADDTITHLMDINEAIIEMRDNSEQLLDLVLAHTRTSEDKKLFFFDGSQFESDHEVAEYEFNLALAYQLNCDVMLFVSAKDRSLSHTLSIIVSAIETGKRNHADITAIIISRIPPDLEQEAKDFFSQNLKNIACIILPEFDTLAHPSVAEIAEQLNARLICGHEEINRPVNQITIAAKTVGNFLQSRVNRQGMLIITPDDRIDVLLGSLLADQSANYPKIAGIVLTGGDMPGEIILNIIEGLEHPFPVLLTSHKTYETATRLYSAKYSLGCHDMQKVHKAIEAMQPYLTPALAGLSAQHKNRTMTMSPAIFLYDLVNRAQKAKRHIVLPEGLDPRILSAADYLLKRKIVQITLLGNEEKIKFLAKKQQLELPGVNIIEIEKSTKREAYAAIYFKLREHKNINMPIALERMTDVNYFAVMMVYCGDADGMVSGAMHTTADTVRPALEIIKTRPKVDKVSSIFIMCMPSRVLIYGDCAINTEPDSATLADIASQAALIANSLGITPKVALLSYSTGASGKGESVNKVSKAMAILHKNEPQLLAEGPIQYDAAVDEEVARKKLPHSKLAGRANVLIFPDLNTGNNTYKAVQRESGALAIGPVLLGLNKPVNDLSRGCTVQDIINTVLITAIQAGENYAHTDH